MRPVINFRGKKYSFSNLAIILFPVGLTILIIVMLEILETIEFVWLQELFAKHMVFFLNLFFNAGAQTLYLPEYPCPWEVTIPDNVTVYINNGCTGIIAMSIFTAIILFSPHSKVPKTKETILWRKSIAIIAAVTLIYLYNVFRATIQFHLYSNGFAWSIVHDSDGMLAITVSFHIVIFLLCSKLVPEWFLSIYYSGKLIINQFMKRSIKEVIYDVKHRGEGEQYKWIRQQFKNKGLDLYLIKMYEVDMKLLKFLKKNKQKYTSKAIKNRLFAQQDNISENLLEEILLIFVEVKWVLNENFEQKNYFYFRLIE